MTSSVSLPFLDESYCWIRAIIVGIQNTATTLAGSVFRFQYSVTHNFFCYRHSGFGFTLSKLFVLCLSNILDTYSIRKQSQLL